VGKDNFTRIRNKDGKITGINVAHEMKTGDILMTYDYSIDLQVTGTI